MMDKQLLSYEQTFTSWTDDIPTCRESGVGSSGNEVYKTDGSRIPNGLHPFEDRSFRFKKEEYGLCLYGVFDGFSGGQVADFVMKRLPAEAGFHLRRPGVLWNHRRSSCRTDGDARGGRSTRPTI